MDGETFPVFLLYYSFNNSVAVFVLLACVWQNTAGFYWELYRNTWGMRCQQMAQKYFCCL